VSTRFQIADNSGAKIAECIKILGRSPLNTAFIGDKIVVSIKKHNNKSKPKAKKGDVKKAIIVNTKRRHTRPDGTYIKFDNNQIVLLNEQQNPLGTRLFTSVPFEVLNRKNKNLSSIASAVI